MLGRDGDDPGLGGEHDVALGVLDPAAGAQAVAVEHGAGHAAIGEGHRRRAVPRLHQARVEVVEALHVGVDVGPRAVGLGDHHHHHVGDRTPAEHQQLQDVVQRGRVRTAAAHHRQHLLEIVTEELGGKLGLPGAHPVDVAAQRVDLAVVGDHAVRVGQLPARERVGGEARVHERQARRHPWIAQVREVPRQLRRGEHPLVDERAAGEAGQRDLGPGGPLDDAADDVELALERALILDVVAGLDDDLADHRRREPRGLAHVAVVDGHVAPPQDLLALGGDRLVDQLLERPTPLGIAGQVADADAVAAGRRQVDTRDGAADERVGDLEQDARAVAGVGIGALGPAMLHVLQRLEGLLHHGVAGLAPELGDEGDAAGIMLIGGVVESSGPGRSEVVHRAVPGREGGQEGTAASR